MKSANSILMAEMMMEMVMARALDSLGIFKTKEVLQAPLPEQEELVAMGAKLIKATKKLQDQCKWKASPSANKDQHRKDKGKSSQSS